MNRVLRNILFSGLLLFLTQGGQILEVNAATTSETTGSGECTRENLKSIADQYFTALEAHDPSGVPFASNARYTENGIEVPVGKGVWETALETTFMRKVIDTTKCGTHIQAIIEEKDNPKPVLYGVRLKIDRDEISEIEAIVVRGGQVLNVPAIMATKDQDWEGILPMEQRSSRLAMMAVADDYFELFVKEKKRKVSDLAYSGFCDRWENGMILTRGGMNQTSVMPKYDCSPEGFADMADTHGPRRFLVDEEAGVVVAYALFNGVWPDFHMFKMNNGLVVWVQAYFEFGKKYKTMGWPDEPVYK